MADGTENRSLVELWDAGLLLEDAAWEFASEYERNKARGTTTIGAFESYFILFRRNVLHMLFDGEIFAFGIRIGTSPTAGPEPIPHHLFRAPEVDWGESSLISGGHRYEQVRVSKYKGAALNPETRDTNLSPPEKQSNAEASKKRMGRPPVGEPLRSVVRELNQANRLSEKSRKEQEHLVRAAAREIYPLLFPRPGQPSRSKILEALKAEGV